MGERDAVREPTNRTEGECQMIGTFIGCPGNGVAVSFTWRGCRLCRICMRIAMVENESLASALMTVASRGWGKSNVGGFTMPQSLADEYLNRWKEGMP